MIFALGQGLLTLGLFAIGAVVLGLAAFPGAWIVFRIWSLTATSPAWWRILACCVAGASGYFLFGFSLMLVVWALRVLLGLRLEEGEHAMGSWASVQWVIVNALQLVVSITFLEFILLTPFAAWFFRLMGAKVGRNAQINSSFCADLPLLDIGEGAVIGGHATVIAHSFESHRLILKRVVIGRQAVVGLNAVVLPGVEIGEGATIAAGAVVPKHARIAAGTVYFGAASDSRRPQAQDRDSEGSE